MPLYHTVYSLINNLDSIKYVQQRKQKIKNYCVWMSCPSPCPLEIPCRTDCICALCPLCVLQSFTFNRQYQVAAPTPQQLAAARLSTQMINKAK